MTNLHLDNFMNNDLKRAYIYLKGVLNHNIGISEGVDHQATIEGIQKDISFRGPTAWILVIAIAIASIGLNVNSTAVVIGAMLISPLMGPILGIGLSVGTNDFETLIRSLKNLGLAVGISLFTSTLYFLVTPLSVENSELLARTSPTILDVLVALFGGFAGAIAGSRKEKTNVIPGVAIATALMPPLCTAGYGLANFKMTFFLGAFYLFFINSVFISLATFLVVKYLKFPLVSYIDKEKAKRYRVLSTAFLVITIIPSVVIFLNVIQETRFNLKANDFVRERATFDGAELLSSKFTYTDTLSKIDLYFIGKKIPTEKEKELNEDLKLYGISGEETFAITDKTIVKIHQGEGNDMEMDKRLEEYNKSLRVGILEDIYEKNEKLMEDKDARIRELENKLIKLTVRDSIPYMQLSKELKFQFKEIKNFSYANTVQLVQGDSSFVYDTIPTFLIDIDNNVRKKDKTMISSNIKEWLNVRLNDTTIRVVNLNE